MNDPNRARKIFDQDEDIFQTARLINCGWFVAVIFSDYLNSILGLVRQGSTWCLNPFGVRRFLSSYSTKLLTIRTGNTGLGSQAFRTWSWQCLQRRGKKLVSFQVIGVLNRASSLTFYIAGTPLRLRQTSSGSRI